MSREFGSYSGGYFHEQIEMCADDALLLGRCEITRKWGAVLKAIQQITYSIASAEAGDSNAADPILQSILDCGNVRAALNQVESYLRPYRDVIERSLEQALEDTVRAQTPGSSLPSTPDQGANI